VFGTGLKLGPYHLVRDVVQGDACQALAIPDTRPTKAAISRARRNLTPGPLSAAGEGAWAGADCDVTRRRLLVRAR